MFQTLDTTEQSEEQTDRKRIDTDKERTERKQILIFSERTASERIDVNNERHHQQYGHQDRPETQEEQ